MRDVLERETIISHFNKAAETYEEAAVLQREVADRLIDRLAWIKKAPQTIVDVGARTGYTTQLLRRSYPQAQILAVDWANHLLQSPSLNEFATTRICAEPDRLPLPAQCADLVVANLVWHWLDDPARSLREWRRLLKPGGLLLLTACGPDTLYELRASFAAVDTYPHVHLFLDMHDIGDAILAAGFADPVMQAEHLYLSYSSLSGLFRDLRGTGVTNALNSRRRTLTGKQRWRQMLAEYQKFSSSDEGFSATIEVVYGVAWMPEIASTTGEEGEVVFPISQLKVSTVQ
jgi:malonyl-CoA O-methyltransferase